MNGTKVNNNCYLEICGYSSDWDSYIKHYNLNYNSQKRHVILKNLEIDRFEKVELDQDNDSVSLKILITSPIDNSLAPLNMIIKLYNDGKEVKNQKFSKRWDEDSLYLDLTYKL